MSQTPDEEQMGSTPFGDADQRRAGLATPQDMKIARGFAGCAMASDRA
jgi:hypothetical protein